MAYVGSQSDVDVFFDDVQVEHRPGLQVQETQYDSAGLELAGLAPPSPGIRDLNNYRFNGKEFLHLHLKKARPELFWAGFFYSLVSSCADASYRLIGLAPRH